MCIKPDGLAHSNPYCNNIKLDLYFIVHNLYNHSHNHNNFGGHCLVFYFSAQGSSACEAG